MEKLNKTQGSGIHSCSNYPEEHSWDFQLDVDAATILHMLEQLISQSHQAYQAFSQWYQAKQSETEHLKMLIRSKDERIAELESLQNPYSLDGEAVCNSLE